MFTLALIRKSLRDYALLWAATLVLVVGVLLVFMLAIHSGAMDQKQDFIKLPFIRRFMTVMIGTDPLDMMSPTAITAFGFTHPVIWALTIAFAISMASGVLAGEMDRGTMDLLATLPIRRSAIYVSLSAALLAMGLPLCWGVWLGVWLGQPLASKAGEVRLDLLIRVTWHLYVTWALIACFALASSSMSSRRGPAVAAAFFFVFYGFVLNLFRAMWPALDVLAWTDFLTYYQPLLIVRDECYRWGDMTVLALAAAGWWALGLMAFVRRDIPAR